MTSKVRISKNRISKRAIIAIALLVALAISLISIAYAWYRNYINVKGSTITSGVLSLEIDGYTVDSDHNVTPIDDIIVSGSSDGSTVLKSYTMKIDEWSRRLHVYYFIKNPVKENATDIEASISISTDNTEIDSSLDGISVDIAEVRFGDIDSDLGGLTEAEIMAEIEQSSIKGIPTDTDVHFINNLEKAYHEFNVRVGEFVCIRVTYDMPEEVAENENIDLSMRVSFCLAQKGKLSVGSTGKTHNVTSLEALQKAVAEYLPNDKISITGKVDFTGDLIFNRPLTLEVKNGELNVYGNLKFAYPYQSRYIIDTDTAGSIAVFEYTVDVENQNGEITGTAKYGGDLIVDAPLSQVELIGKNSTDPELGDIYVQKNFKVRASMPTVGSNYKNGLVVNGSMIYPIDANRGDETELKTIQIGNHTMVSVRNYTTVGTIASSSSVIEIENRGIIGGIDLSGMVFDPEYREDQPQIYINNYSELVDIHILLPEDWADKFVKNLDGTFEGNTRIYEQPGSGPLTTNTTVGFQSDGSRDPDRDDIEYAQLDSYVTKVNGRADSVTVQYTNATGLYLVGTSTDIGAKLETLISYYSGVIPASKVENAAEGEYVSDALKIAAKTELKSVTVVCYGTEITSADYTYIRGMSGVEYLDLSETSSTGLKTPNSAFKNMTNLKTVIPSNLDTTWGESLFTGTKVDEIRLPDSLASIAKANTLTGIKYVHTASRNVANVIGSSKNFRYVFVPYGDSVTMSYYNTSTYNGYVYYDAERYTTDIGDYFLRVNENQDVKTVEFVAFNPLNSGNDNTVAFSFTFDVDAHLNGEAKFDFKTITLDGTVYDIECYSDYSFFKKAFTSGSEIELADTLKEVKPYAFGNATGISSLTINGDPLINSYAFSATTATTLNIRDNPDIKNYGFSAFKANVINIDKTPVLGNYAFNSSTAKAVLAPNVVETGTQSFANMTSLVKAYFPSLRRTSDPFYKCTKIFMLHIGIFEEGTKLGGGSSAIDNIFICTDETDVAENYSYVLEYAYSTGTSNVGALIVPSEFSSMYKYYGLETVSLGTDQDRMDDLKEYYNPNDPFSDEGYTFPNVLYYENEDGTITIFRYLDYSPAATTDLFAIPKEDGTGNYEVSALSSCAYRNVTITRDELIFPDSLKTIGSYAFHPGLEDVKKKLKTIGRVDLANVETIGTRAFRYSKVTVFEGYNVTQIGDYSFGNSDEVVAIIFPKLTTILTNDTTNGHLNAFNSCSKLRLLYMGPLDDDTIVRKNLLSGSGAIDYVIVDASEKDGGSSAATDFYVTNGSTTTTVQPTTLVISDDSTWSFRNAVRTDKEFSNIVVSGSINRLGTSGNYSIKVPQYMFELRADGTAKILKCTYVGTSTDPEIPNKVVPLEEKNDYIAFSFNKCQIIDAEEDGGYKVSEMARGAYNTATVNSDLKETTTLHTGPYITSIPNYGFYGKANILHFDLESVTTIGEQAFRDADIKSIKADKVTTISTYAFYESDALTELSFPSIKTIGSYAFMGMSALVNVSLGRDMTSNLTDRLFVSCAALRNIELNADKYISLSSTVFDYNNSTSTRQDLITIKVRAKNYASYSASWHNTVKAIEIIENEYVDPITGITYYYDIIGDTNNVILTHLKVPAEYAETSITLPSSFQGIKMVDETEVTVEFTVTEVDKNLITAILGVASVTEITFPENVERIEGCLATITNKITSVTVPDANMNYKTVDGVLYSKDGSYLIYYPKGKADTEFTVPNGVEYIAEGAFSGNTYLTSVTLNGQVTVMTKAFNGCTALVSVTFTNTEPSLLLGTDIFTGANKNLLIYVPEASLELYKSSVILDLAVKDKITAIVTE